MQNFKPQHTFGFILIIMCILFSCATDNSQIKDIYLAEKLFYKAGKVQQNILINPDIASPEQYAKAEKIYRSVIEKYDEESRQVRELKGIVQRSWMAIADLYKLQKKFDEAIAIYNEIINNNSSHDKELCAVAQFSIASNLENQKKIDESIEAYQKLVDGYPPVLSDTLLPNMNILQTPNHIARLYLQNKENSLASQHYRKAIEYYQEINQKYADSPVALAALNQIAVSYGDQGNWRKAVEIIEQGIAKYEQKYNVSTMSYTLGNIYFQRLNQPEKALNIFRKIIQQNPESDYLGQVHLSRGQVYLSQKNYELARDEFSTVLNKFSSDRNSSIQAQLSIARSYELENNWSKALNEYQWVVDNYPKSVQSLEIPLYIADYYQQQGQREFAIPAYEDAVRKYQQVLEQYPNTMFAILAQDYLSISYMKMEKWQQAVAALEALLQMKIPPQKQANTYIALGSIYEEKLGDEQKAVDAYSTLVQKYPDIPIADNLNSKIKFLQDNIAYYQKSNQPPVTSKILNTELLTANSLEISWTANTEGDFKCYKLFRSQSPDVNQSSEMVAQIYDPEQDRFVDNNVEEGNTYHYRLYVYDKGDLFSESNEISKKIDVPKFTANVNLNGKSNSWSESILNWNIGSNIKDFDSYKIYRSQNPEVSIRSQLVKSIFDQTITEFVDNELKQESKYYYKVFVYNSKGANYPSNEIEITTQKNDAPEAVFLKNPSTNGDDSIELSWTMSNEDDFLSYRIYRSDKQDVAIKGTPVWMISNKSINNYKDKGLVSGKTYYYKIVVYDKGGLYTESNEVVAKL